jgi:A/G-specific adenine glycosylase
MPWRSNPIPYYVWISEMMLQQTQVDTVIPYFKRFITTFPDVFSLASADQEKVLKCWEGLGYYSRARNLHKAAKAIVETRGSQIPSTFEDLQTLPGIGPYCAAAIASIAFEEPVPVVDGNVLRVFTRFWGIFEDIKQPKVRLLLFEKLKPYIQTCKPSDFNQAIMELGALICKPKSPTCLICPLQSECLAYQTQAVHLLPVKSKADPVPHYTIAVGVIWKDGDILIGKRKTEQMLGGLWEFPGGKQQENETLEDTVKREVYEETSLDIRVLNKLTVVKHAYSHFKITLHAYTCAYISGTPTPNSTDELRWVKPDTLLNLPFPKANIHIIKEILKPPSSIEDVTLFGNFDRI